MSILTSPLLLSKNINAPKMFSFCELFTFFDKMYVNPNMLKLGSLCVPPQCSTQATKNVQSDYYYLAVLL